MIYLIIGASCSGKSTIVVNSFIKGKNPREFKDILPICETDNAFLIGKWFFESRVKGLDRIARSQIPKIVEQVKRLIPRGKDIVLEGDKIVSRKIFDELLETGEECQLYWIKCSEKATIERNRNNGSTQKESSIKTVATKAKNIFWEYAAKMHGGVIDTENRTNWNDFSLQTSNIDYPFEKEERKDNNDNNDFAVFILTHGRADNMCTYSVLRRDGYTGKVYFILDNEDDQIDLYKKNFGEENIIVFDKAEQMKKVDPMDNFDIHSAILYARTVSFQIAKDLGLKYFLQLDDDYVSFMFRYIEDGKLSFKEIKDLDRVFRDAVQFLIDSDALTVALSQGGDYIGGVGGEYFYKGLARKAMNSFFCRTDRPIPFAGTMNEDVSMYVTQNSKGQKIFSFTTMCLIQKPTQSLSGGMTQVYKDAGAYLKPFYSVIAMPSAVRVDMLNSKHKRMHHKVNWNNCAPKILNERYRKVR